MSAELLSDSAVKALIVKGHDDVGSNWIERIALLERSTRPTDKYVILGEVPRLEEYIGSRQAKELRENEIELTNVDYDATLKIKKNDLRRDRTRYLEMRIQGFWAAAAAHWKKLASTLLINGTAGTSGLAYDGQYFFDTDHVLGASGTMSNDITVDISTLPVAVHGSTTAPSPEEAALVILLGIQQLQSLKDDQGEPLNEDMTSVTVQCPVSLGALFQSAAVTPIFADNRQNVLASLPIKVTVEINARLTWTTAVAVIRDDGGRPAFIAQEQDDLEMQYLGLDSEHCKIHKETLYIMDASRAMGYGDFRAACYVAMT